MEAPVQTMHPQHGKRNRPVRRQDYDRFRDAITAVLRDRELTHTELVAAVTDEARVSFGGNVSWHVMTVKLDLEARGAVVRTSSRPQRYRLA